MHDGIRAVLFDAGGVLLLPDPNAVRAAFAPFGAAPDDERCRRAHYVSALELERLGHVDWPAVDAVYAVEAGVPEDRAAEAARVVEDLYLRTPWVPVEGAAEALRAVQDAGFELAIVSNAEGTVEEDLAGHEICSVRGGPVARVAVVIDSTVVGVEKPDPRIFEFALDALGLPAASCLYVGDTVYFDVNGARAAGLVPVHLDPYDLCPLDDHHHVARLDDLVGKLTGPSEHG